MSVPTMFGKMRCERFLLFCSTLRVLNLTNILVTKKKKIMGNSVVNHYIGTFTHQSATGRSRFEETLLCKLRVGHIKVTYRPSCLYLLLQFIEIYRVSRFR